MGEQLILRPRSAARALDISRSKLYELIADGELELIQLGERMSGVPMQSILDFIERRRAASQPKVNAA